MISLIKLLDCLRQKEIVGKERKGYLWRCECECGGEKVVPASYLRNGHTKSCGCIMKNIRSNSIKKATALVDWKLLSLLNMQVYPPASAEPFGILSVIAEMKRLCLSVMLSSVMCVLVAVWQLNISQIFAKRNITDQTFGRLKATHPTEKRTLSGSIIWELECECGNTVHKSVNELKNRSNIKLRLSLQRIQKRLYFIPQ